MSLKQEEKLEDSEKKSSVESKVDYALSIGLSNHPEKIR